MFGANQGSGERNDEEAVAAREGSSLYRGTGPTMPALISTALDNLSAFGVRTFWLADLQGWTQRT